MALPVPDVPPVPPASPAAEAYTPERQAAFLLDNATDAADYAAARRDVAEVLDIDPDTVPHLPPATAGAAGPRRVVPAETADTADT